jgi:hypothetical protein
MRPQWARNSFLAGAKVTAAFLDINQKGILSTAPAGTIVFLTLFVSGDVLMMITEWIPVIVVRTVQ